MNKTLKLVAALGIVSFLVPVVASFCCCAQKSEPRAHSGVPCHPHQEDQHGRTQPAHDHNQCSHPQTVADLVQKTIQNDLPQSPAFKGLTANDSVLSHVTLVLTNTTGTLLDAGPPGPGISNPLYLGISILRI